MIICRLRLLTPFCLLLPCLFVLTACDHEPPASAYAGAEAWKGARIWTGVGEEYLDDVTLLVQSGRVVALHEGPVPHDVIEHDVTGKYIIPGLINAHGHVGVARGLETGPAAHSRENVQDQLQLYARYGVTTVVSLGDEPDEAFAVRDEMTPEDPGMARLFLAGEVLSPDSPETAPDDVASLSRQNPDWVKIRVDDQLGTREKMAPSVYGAVIEAAHEHNHPAATHMVTLEDSKGLLRAGTDLLAHSVRDAPVDQELIDLMLEGDICITPTLTREVSVYIYADRPAFFDDPFFLKAADPAVVDALQQPDVQAQFTGDAADFYREALPLATDNMMALHEAGVRVAMGTDSGPPARFQGYFEHMEMEMMQDAGMTPLEILVSATRDAARCTGIGDELGTLEPGKWADFLVLSEDPMADVTHLRNTAGIYLAGQAFEE